MLCLRKSAAGALAWAFAFWSIQWPGQAFIFRRLEPAATPNHEENMRTRCTADRQLQRCELALRGGAGNVRQIATLEEFEEVLSESGDTLVCVDFTATWCSPCQQIAPMFEQLSQDLGDVVFVKVDVDENEETAQKYDVFQMPTFLFIRNGEVVDQFSGANEVVLRQKVELLKVGKDGDAIIHDHVQEETNDLRGASRSDLEDDAVDSSNDPDSS